MMHNSEIANTEAAVLGSAGVQTIPATKAIGKVRSALSVESPVPKDLYAIVVFSKNDPRKPANELSTWNALFRAYWQSWRRLTKLASLHLTPPSQDHLTTLNKQDFGDICVYWGRGKAEDVKKEIEPTPGVYILTSRLDTQSLGLPALPERFQEGWVVVQVKTIERSSEQDSDLAEWNPWETLARSVADEEHLDPETGRDTLEWRKRFMSENKCWSSADVARESGSSAKNQAAIASRWIQEKRIFSVPFERKTWFPRFQFRDGRPIPAVSSVIKAFPDHATGWDLAYFFTSPNSFVGGRKPLELLKEDPKRLESLAQSFANPADAF